jgi:GTA TIM-barrel-like domain/Putative phage tail protein
MASIILSAAGASAGNFMYGTIGATLGQLLGAGIGNLIDNHLFASNTNTQSFGARLKDLSIQSASYGGMIPVVYGCVRISGNIIWASPIREVKKSQTHSIGSSKTGKVTRTHTEYSYFANIAIALCEGSIKGIGHVWANNALLNLSLYTMRIYKGSEEQLPDPLIEAQQGINQTPAYRGLAYVVFEDFPLSDFANILPNFTFEVTRNLQENSGDNIQDLVESIVIIPGSGEFVYDTIAQAKVEGSESNSRWIQRGPAEIINCHTTYGKTNAEVSLNQLKDNLPNVKWVAPTVAWFATSLEASNCNILPGVEFSSQTMTSPSAWKVAGFDRANAHPINKVAGNPIYGGTINDQSLLRYLDYLRQNNYKIMLYPVLMVDLIAKPWRGRITADVAGVGKFFNQKHGYKNYILHYAKLTKDKIDAFVIGSELIGLTKVHTADYQFPAVSELIELATQVKNIVGSNVKVTYAADWSEYHHTDGGWYNLDPLWASEAIDVVGIDAYFPLTEAPSSQYDIEKIMQGWKSGEGFDYYYADALRTHKQPLAPSMAWKNLQWWWENEHINPSGQKSPWLPKAKKIWFTEYGFPSVDCCTNQPNVFYDPKCAESYFPYHSKGRVDFKAQMQAIIATEKQWRNSMMIERKFLWTWDARPYPYWPDLLSVWGDGNLWLKGHWIQGKLNSSHLSAVLRDLCNKAGIKNEQVNAQDIHHDFQGMCINQQFSIKQAIELLQNCYNFDVTEINQQLTFTDKTKHNITKIAEHELLPQTTHGTVQLCTMNHLHENQLFSQINVNFIDSSNQYKIGNQHFQKHSAHHINANTLDLPIVLNPSEAKNLAEVALYKQYSHRVIYNFSLPGKFIFLTPGDLLELTFHDQKHLINIIDIQIVENLELKIFAHADNLNLYSKTNQALPKIEIAIPQPSSSKLLVLDLPALSKDTSFHDSYVWLACAPEGKNWHGCTIFGSFAENSGYEEIAQINNPATIGTALTPLKNKNPCFFDNESKIIVNLLSGQLYSITQEDLLQGGNLALIGTELIHFKNARLINHYQYELSGFIRGRQGTESSTALHHANEDFILIDNLQKLELPIAYQGRKFYMKALSAGQTNSSVTPLEFTYQANRLRPLSPVHVKFSAPIDKLNWIRRTRINGEMKDNIDVPLVEEQESYLVEFLDRQNRVIHRLQTEKPEFYFTQFLRELKAAKISIAQLSYSVGAGHAAIFTLPTINPG